MRVMGWALSRQLRLPGGALMSAMASRYRRAVCINHKSEMSTLGRGNVVGARLPNKGQAHSVKDESSKRTRCEPDPCCEQGCGSVR